MQPFSSVKSIVKGVFFLSYENVVLVRDLMIKRVTSSEDETRSFGETLGSLLKAGDVVLLSGELGVGKTRLAQGIAKGLGCLANVTSPTFVLINEYPGDVTFFHADLYRLEKADLGEIGLWDSTEQGVLVVEWPERAGDSFPESAIGLALSFGLRDNERVVEFSATGERGQSILASGGFK